jgi:hypothetical protein
MITFGNVKCFLAPMVAGSDAARIQYFLSLVVLGSSLPLLPYCFELFIVS